MNKAILMGRLTRDPEVRYTQSNTVVTNFTLAIDRRFVRQGEERQADFIPIVTFGKTAEFCEKWFKKGQQVLVVGRIQTRSWDDNEGRKRYTTEVVSDECYFADSKRADGDYGGGGGGNRQDSDYGFYPQMQQGAPGSYGMARPAGGGGGNAGGGNAGGAPRPTAPMPSTEPAPAADYAAPGGAPDDDGFTPIENESDLPF